MTTETSAGLELAAYFDRIGYAGPAQPTVETLHALVAAHNGSPTSDPPGSATSWSVVTAAAIATSKTG